MKPWPGAEHGAVFAVDVVYLVHSRSGHVRSRSLSRSGEVGLVGQSMYVTYLSMMSMSDVRDEWVVSV